MLPKTVFFPRVGPQGVHESILLSTALGNDGQGPKGFSFVFPEFSGFLFAFSDLLTDLARACLGFLERPSRSYEFVRVDMVRTIAQRPSVLDRENGPDLTSVAVDSQWQSSCAGVFKGRK